MKIVECYNMPAIRAFRKWVYCDELSYEEEETEATPYLDQIGTHIVLLENELIVGYVLIVGHTVHRLMLLRAYRTNKQALSLLINRIFQSVRPYALIMCRPALTNLIGRCLPNIEFKKLRPADKPNYWHYLALEIQ